MVRNAFQSTYSGGQTLSSGYLYQSNAAGSQYYGGLSGTWRLMGVTSFGGSGQVTIAVRIS